MNEEETSPDGDSMETAWLELCDTLRRVPETIARLERSDDPRIRAEGYRYFSRLIRMALERGFEGADPDFPRFLFAQGPSRKIGGDCPDAVYRDCTLDGRGQYRVFGEAGNAASVIFSINRDPARAAVTKQSVLIETIDLDELSLGPDRSFELWLGGERRTENWRPLDPDSGSLMIRQFFGAMQPSAPAKLSIERIDLPDDSASALHPDGIERAIQSARLFLEHIPETWGAELHGLLDAPNQLAALAPEHQARLQATPGGIPLWGSFRIAATEALIVEFKAPVAEYWSLLAGGPWFESLDARTRIGHLNMDQCQVDSDGFIRVVIAHDDPGIPNWLETSGNEEGFLLLRSIGSDRPPEVTCRVIPFSRVRDELPAETGHVDLPSRKAERARRRGSSDRRFEGL